MVENEFKKRVSDMSSGNQEGKIERTQTEGAQIKRTQIRYRHAVIRITQLPIRQKFNGVLLKQTWMNDIFGRTFGVRLSMDRGLMLEFYWKLSPKQDARVFAAAKLNLLRMEYPGLDGEVKVEDVDDSFLANIERSTVIELLFPLPPYSRPLPLMSLFSSLSTFLPRGLKMKIYVLLRRCSVKAKNDLFSRTHSSREMMSYGVPENINQYTVPEDLKKDMRNSRLGNRMYSNRFVENYWELGDKKKMKKELWTGVPFKVRIFIQPLRSTLKNQEIREKSEINGSNGSNESNESNGSNGSNESVESIKSSFNIIKQSISGGIVNLLGERVTFRFLRGSEAHVISDMDLSVGAIFTDNTVDFNFQLGVNTSYPIKRGKMLPGENFTPKIGMTSNRDCIRLGSWIKNGVVQNAGIFIKTDKLVFNLLLGGQTGSGKTTALLNIGSQIRKNRPDVGILIINLAKRGEHRIWKGFKLVSYTDLGFSMPYFSVGENIRKSREDAAILIAMGAFSMPDFARRYFDDQMTNYYRDVHLKFPVQFPSPAPREFSKLLKNVLKLISHHYDMNNRQRIWSVLSLRMDIFLKDEKFLEVVNLGIAIGNGKSDGFIDYNLDWLDGVLNRGEKIFLDLSMCRDEVKRFLVMVLLQKIETYTEHRNRHDDELLKTLLIFDEAHKAFSRNDYGDPTSDLGQSQSFLDKIFSKYFTEFRSRGIGTIISDQTPSSLMRAVATQPNLKVLFKIDKNSAGLYTDDMQLRQFIIGQRQFSAVVINGLSGEISWMQIPLHFNSSKT